MGEILVKYWFARNYMYGKIVFFDVCALLCSIVGFRNAAVTCADAAANAWRSGP